MKIGLVRNVFGQKEFEVIPSHKRGVAWSATHPCVAVFQFIME
jgi:hypothetical protein